MPLGGCTAWGIGGLLLLPPYPCLGLNSKLQLLLWQGETEEKLLVIQEPTGGNGGVRQRELGLQAGAPE